MFFFLLNDLKIFYVKPKDSKNEASLKRIRFAHLSNVYQLMELLWAPDTTQFQIVIIDSLASLFGAILGDSSNDCIYI